MTGTTRIIQGDARHLDQIEDESIDVIITSPPYPNQRSYRATCPRCDGSGCLDCDGSGWVHVEGQIGSEAHPSDWLEAMWAVMRECWRVLKPTGSCWVNLGDKRAGSGGHNNGGISKPHTGSLTGEQRRLREAPAQIKATRRNAPDRYSQAHYGRPKSRQAMPERFLIGCMDGLADPEGIGWIYRQCHPWLKPNGLPESVDDRCRDDFEFIYMFTKQPDYFAGIDEIRSEVQWSSTPSKSAPASRSGFCPRCGLPRTAAGSGRPGSRRRGTENLVADDVASRRTLPTEHPTNSSLGPSLTDSTSTTSAATEAASTPSTWSPSPSERTCYEDTDGQQSTPSRPTAATATLSAPPTPTEPPTEAECAVCVCEPEIVAPTGGIRGALPGSVWTIPSEPLNIPDYFVEDDRGWRMWGTKRYGKPRKPKDLGDLFDGITVFGLDPGTPVVPELAALWTYCAERLAEGYEGPIRVGHVDHFAAFPSALPEKIIRGFAPTAICTACGEGRRPVVEKKYEKAQGGTTGHQRDLSEPEGNNRGWSGKPSLQIAATILGYACACTPHTDHAGKGGSGQTHAAALAEDHYVDTGSNANGKGRTSLQNRPKTGGWREYHLAGWTPPPTRPSVILDVCGGTGTTAVAANALGRDAILVDISPDYCNLARWRVEHSGHGRKVEQRSWKDAQGSLL